MHLIIFGANNHTLHGFEKFSFKLFAEYPNVDLHAMGFPQSWENEPLWRL